MAQAVAQASKERVIPHDAPWDESDTAIVDTLARLFETPHDVTFAWFSERIGARMAQGWTFREAVSEYMRQLDAL